MLAAMPERDEAGRLLTVVVHELRTPLNVAVGYLKMLLDPRAGPLTERQAQLAARAGESLDTMARLLSDLGAIARLDAGESLVTRRRHDLAALAASVVEAFAATRQAPRVALDARAGSCLADLDVERLARAFRACLDAVAREASEGDALVVSVTRFDPSTAAVTLAPSRLVSALGEGARWEPADEWRGGLGLELPLARRVIERHGGRVLSPAGPDRRPVFRVLLPLADASRP